MNDLPPIICIIAPSGAGKDTIVRALLSQYPDRFRKFVSTTTRTARPGEVDGVDYNFVTDAEFDQWVSAGKMIMPVEFSGARYGTLVTEVERNDRTLLMLVVESVAEKIKEMFGDRVHILALVVDEETVKSRMLLRGDDPAVVQKRLADDRKRQADMHRLADHKIRNDDLDKTIHDVDAWITKKEQTRGHA